MTVFPKGFKSHGIREPLTNRIAGILDEYPDGTQIARELLQNSDDARSTVQWYLLDHRHHGRNQVDGPKLFHKDLLEYMGPALLAGSDSLFEEKDFKSMKNLAASEKKTDETKIGQMGIGFNSIYHMTDCPSFISGDQFMVVEPHERIFNGENSPFTEGAVRGSFVEENAGLSFFPDQLKTFSVLEDIDFTKPYPGTIFRFPLRTNEQAQISLLSKSAYPSEMALRMLMKLKHEALRGILFLKHIERIEIYEIKEGQDRPSKLFQIEIVNAEEVRRERRHLLANLRAHVYPDPSSSIDAILEYSVRPIFKLTQEDGTVTQETWHITTMVGNVLTAHEFMAGVTDGDLSSHKLIPWVGIGAPAEPGTKIDMSRLFCFLPIGIQLPFPVHVNGHFAVKQSRREIWTNQDNDFASHSSAYIKSVWNVHLFKSHIPVVYAKFLNTLGLARGPSYDLWPVSCGQGLGLDAIWKNLLTDTLRVVCEDNLPVFFCKDGGSSDHRVVDYQSSWVAARDIDEYPLLLDALQNLVNVVTGLPDPVLNAIPGVVESLDLDNRILTPTLVRDLLREHKRRWSSVVSNETKVEMLKYCIEDNDIADLEGLPLLPLAGNQWVEFEVDKSNSRYLVSQEIFKVLSYSNDGLVDIDVDPILVGRFKFNDAFKIFWSPMECSIIASRVKDVFQRLFYKSSGNTAQPEGTIAQPSEGFPTAEWISDFWGMVDCCYQDRETLLSLLEGTHLLPITQERLAPLSRAFPVVYISHSNHEKEPTLVSFLDVLEDQLGYRVLQPKVFITDDIAEGYVFEVSDAVMVLQALTRVERGRLHGLDQKLREVVCQFMAKWLPVDQAINDVNLRTLRSLPIYKLYEGSTLVSLDGPETGATTPKWRVAWRFSSADYPWLPTAFRLLADEQLMGQHLTKLIKIQTIKESEYWFLVISDLDHYPEDDWDSIVEKMCIMYHIHKQEHDFASVMRDRPFVRTTGPNTGDECEGTCARRLSPRSTVDPAMSQYYMAHEQVFPAGVYSRPPVFGVLAEMGMQSKFDASFIQDRVDALSCRLRRRDSGLNDSGTGNISLEDRSDALFAMYTRINADFKPDFSTEEMQEVLRSRPWILAKSRSDTTQQLCSTQECRPQSDVVIIGDQMPISKFEFSNKDLIQCMGWDQSAPLSKVLDHFATVIGRLGTGSVSDEDSFALHEIYCYLHSKIDNPSDLEAIRNSLNGKQWILVNGALRTADRVSMKVTCDLSPHFFQVTTTDSRLKNLFLAMGVREVVGQTDLQGLISTVAAKYGDDEKILEADSDLVVKILQAMTDVEFKWTPDLLIPTTDRMLCKTTDVVYDDVGLEADMPDLEGSATYKITNSKISKSVAEKLQVSMLSTRHWNDQNDAGFESWSQKEEILDRLAHILNDYHPSSIFTEFLQNAEDAGATKCCFMLDRTSYPKNKILGPEMARWQGPALVIYNNAEFTDDDFNGLCKLGAGNKRSDSSKIGRHGLGFNSAYHFTDVPSVLSGKYIGFFDPRHQFLPAVRTAQGVTVRGGQRCELARIRDGYLSDQLAPYMNIFGCDMGSHFKGTIFRIPLRADETEPPNGHEKTLGRTWTPGQVEDMFRSWAKDAKLGMLFLDNMATIEIKNNVRSDPDFMWSATKTIGSKWPQVDKELSEQIQLQHKTPMLTRIVNISVKASATTNTETSQWLVHIEHDFPPNTSEDIKGIAVKNRWNANRGIAIPLDFISKGLSDTKKLVPFRGQIFSHLPTPTLTGLPFHIHGVFALTSSRKTLAGGTDMVDPRREWNHFVLADALPSTATHAFEKLLVWMFRKEGYGGPKVRELDFTINQYFQLWPLKVNTEDIQAQTDVTIFIKSFLRRSFDRPIFPCRKPHRRPPVLGFKGKDTRFTGSSLCKAPGSLNSTIRDHLMAMEENVCNCPDQLHILIESNWKIAPILAYKHIDPDSVRGIIRDEPMFIPDTVKTIEEKRWILEFTLKALLNTEEFNAMQEPLDGLALVPLVNGEWQELQPEEESSSTYYTANPQMRELIKGSDILMDESLFGTLQNRQQGDPPKLSTLEQILECLVSRTDYSIRKMTQGDLAARICEENPGEIPYVLRINIWTYLYGIKDLSSFGEVRILETLSRKVIPLKHANQGLELSNAYAGDRSQNITHTQRVCELAALLEDLGIIVFDATLNGMHPYWSSHVHRAERDKILSALAGCYDSWPDGRLFTTGEARVLREMIRSTGNAVSWYGPKLGQLRIWESWNPNQDAGFIHAHGSYFVESDMSFNWSELGHSNDLIRDTDCRGLLALGAKPLSVIDIVETRLLPQFLDGSLKCTGSVREKYLEIFREIIRLATQPGLGSTPAAKDLLQNKCFILTRDGTFQRGIELLNAQDTLSSIVFGDVPSRFPDPAVWDLIWAHRQLFVFRDSKYPVVQECAFRVLDMTQGRTEHLPDEVRAVATEMVAFVYKNGDDANWLLPKWRFVPVETASEPPYSERVPDLPKYLSFGELVDPSWHDISWTQCGFFPDNLRPSHAFKQRFPSIGQPTTEAVVEHLKVLVTELAPRWTSLEQWMALKTAIFKVYKFLNDEATHSSAIVTRLLQEKLKDTPFILRSTDANPSEPTSWLKPQQLMLDINEDMDHFHKVHVDFLSFRQFLLAAGVQQMQNVVGGVDVSSGRNRGGGDAFFLKLFEAQDHQSGFMDLRFKFADGHHILAHKVVLAYANEYFLHSFQEVKMDHTDPDSLSSCTTVIDLSEKEVHYTSFFDLVYYFYADRMLPSPSEHHQDRLQHLIELLGLAHKYQVPRLKELIAFEIVASRMITHRNVFSIRTSAKTNCSKEVLEHCDKFLKLNSPSIRTHINEELKACREESSRLSGGDSGAQKDELERKAKELENDLELLERL
ncbi:hypothetical protein BGX31_006891 [Mortierella sp. GBA43]|nr:hypothetical protein BGX31_006891 [Mortierella sp. GBA43]